MSQLSELYGEETNNTNVEECLEQSLITQDDYKLLKRENERYRQEVYSLRLKLETGIVVEKELQETNKALELSLAQSNTEAKRLLAEEKTKYRAAEKEYENQITDLQNKITEDIHDITELRKQLEKYTDLANSYSKNLDTTENISVPCKEEIEELMQLVQDETKKRQQLEEQLVNMNNQNQELQNILHITKNQLMEKNEMLEYAREELATNRIELESVKMRPASDTCKGNSLFAEVEDRRQILLNKMTILKQKYDDAKQIIKMKANEMKILQTKYASVVMKWETDAIDTLQENTELLDKYKSKVFELQNKLQLEVKKNNDVKKQQPTDDSFNYAKKLLDIKKKEVECLNEKLENQSMKMLAQEEENHSIAKQLRYWRHKAMVMESKILTITTQNVNHERKRTDNNHNKTAKSILYSGDSVEFEGICSSDLTSDISLSDNDTYQPLSTEINIEKSNDR